jgi:hypothetical protein
MNHIIYPNDPNTYTLASASNNPSSFEFLNVFIYDIKLIITTPILISNANYKL